MPRQPQPSKHQRWAITINNYDEHTLDNLNECGRFKYYVFGKETAPQTGTLHLQGYVVFNTPLRLNQVSSFLPTAHIEPARATHKANIEYCKKEGDFIEKGELPIDGNVKGGAATKEKYQKAWELAKLNRVEEIDADIRLKYLRTIKQIAIDYFVPKQDLDDTCGIWYYGQSGVGKSYRARQENPDAYLKRPNKWWDGYLDQEAVILDDLDKSHAYLSHDLKIWADRYAFTAECKGGHLHIRPKKIIVTSQYMPEEIWEDNKTLDAIQRRFSIITVMHHKLKIKE